MRVSQLVVAASLALTPTIFAADDVAARLDNAADVLHDMMHMDDKGVPQDLIDHAQCVGVIPGLKKAGFIVGGKYGKGFVVCRKAGAGWSAPAAVRIEGGSVGFQIGGSEQDVVMIVKSMKGEQKLLQDKFTIGGDASAAAGPVGRDLSAQTDAQLHAEILSYSRSRGLFAGIALEGATLRPDKESDHMLYGHDVTNKEILQGDVAAPASAMKFENLLNRTSMQKNGM